MNKTFRHFITTIIAAFFYFLFQQDTPIEEHSSISNNSIDLTHNNYYKLAEGQWNVIAFRNCNEYPVVPKANSRNLAFLFINTIKKAEMAAKLMITDPKKGVLINNGIFIKDNKEYNINRKVSFMEALDFYVYYWALDTKRVVTSESSMEFVLDQSVTSIAKLLNEIFTFYITI